MKVYQRIVGTVIAYKNCKEKGNGWANIHDVELLNLIKNHLPHGSGIDAETIVNIEETTTQKLVIDSHFHAMNDFGYYEGWIDFKVVVMPDLLHGFNVDIRGRFGKRQDIKDYLAETYMYFLDNELNPRIKEAMEGAENYDND